MELFTRKLPKSESLKEFIGRFQDINTIKYSADSSNLYYKDFQLSDPIFVK